MIMCPVPGPTGPISRSSPIFSSMDLRDVTLVVKKVVAACYQHSEKRRYEDLEEKLLGFNSLQKKKI